MTKVATDYSLSTGIEINVYRAHHANILNEDIISKNVAHRL